MRRQFTEKFKEGIVQKALMPGSPGIMRISEKIGVHHTSVRKWIKIHGNGSPMKKSKSKHQKNDSWTPEEKLQAIIETASMSEKEFGEFLRKKGIHSADLEEWKSDCTTGLKSTVGRPKKDPEVLELRKKEKDLQKDLRRKEKALAEMSARVILLKKSREIFGDDEDDE